MKELSATSAWQDVTHATIIDKGLPLRKGFGSLSDAIDVGSVSLTLHMESLDAAALLHTSRKQVLIHADGAPIFEGVSFDDADVDLDMNTDYVYASLKFKPYSSLFEQAKVPSDTVLTDVKICDPADAEHSLVHILFGMIVENMPDPLPAIISPSFGITTSVSNTKVLPLVILEKGEGLEDILTSVLYQNGYTYYMEQFSVILIEPYASGREPTSQVPITSILAKPSISQAPYIKETKCSVRFPRVEQYANEVVYELNGDRIEGTDEPSQVQVLEPADYYPTDDEEPATLEADYSTERETDDIELVYVTGATLDVHTRALSGDSTVRVHITAGTHELDPTKARIQLYNNLTYDVSLRNIRVLAGIAYYRNWSALYEDDDATATDTDEIDGLYMPDTATARAFISRYRSEISAEKTSVEFSTHLDFTPGTLIELAGLPYWLLIRSVTDRRDGSDIKDYSCVAYRIHTVATSTRIRVSGNAKVRNAFSPVPVRLFALGNAEAPYEDSIVVADDAMIASDNDAILGASAAWQLTRPTPGAGEYVWYIIGWYTPPSTWPQTWTVPVKDEGLAAYALQLSAPEGTNFYMSGRGVLQTPTLKFTAILSNIPPASVVWTASNGTLIEVTGDAYSRQLDCSTVSQDNVQITISAMVAGQSYSASIGVQRVRETLVTKYFGISNEMLVNMHGEPLASGDTFLYMPKVGEAYDDTNPLFGHVLKWDGDSWESTTDSQSIGFAAKDAFQIARETGKVIFAAVIYTEAMVAANIQAGSGTGAAGSGFRFRAMDDDYSQEGNPKVPVFDVMYDNKKLFEVVATGTDAGDVIIGDYANGNGIKYDKSAGKFSVKGTIEAGSSVPYSTVSGAPPSDADNTSTFFASGTAFQTANGKVKIHNDGTIEAVDGSFTGNIVANSGLFKGIFDTTALKLEPGTANSHSASYGNENQAMGFCNYFVSQGLSEGTFYKASIPSGIYNWRYSSSITKQFNGGDVKYVKFDIYSYYVVSFYDSNLAPLTTSVGDIRLGGVYNDYYVYGTLSITLYTGGDVLQLSDDVPLSPTNLEAYQIYMNPTTGALMAKLP